MSSSQQTLPADVEVIKAEGNKLFTRGLFAEALEKYTIAIKKSPDNAILFANRAACYNSLKSFSKAKEDASTACKLDSNYAKAWGRLGTAHEGLGEVEEAKEAYECAMRCLESIETLSGTNRKLLDEYKAAYMTLEFEKRTRVFSLNLKTPTDLVRELPRQPPESSAWAILLASNSLEKGMKIIEALVEGPGNILIGHTGGLECLSNAILADERCFILREDPNALIQKYNKNMFFEAHKFGASSWADCKDPYQLLSMAKQRLSQGGWHSVRGALAITVRAWIMQGFLGTSFGLPAEEAVTWFERAITFIELGRKEWPDVHRELRGVIFETSFLRAVRDKQMGEYMKVVDDNRNRKKDPKFTVDRIIELADIILNELETDPMPPVDGDPLGWATAYYLRPKAEALSAKACVYVRKAAILDGRREITTKEDEKWVRMAVDFYLQAANVLPEDEENHSTFLGKALEYLIILRDPISKALPIAERLEKAVPKMLKIWKNSAAALDHLHINFIRMSTQAKDIRDSLAKGEYGLDDPVPLALKYVLLPLATPK